MNETLPQCFCGISNKQKYMIQCSSCYRWFHEECVLSENQTEVKSALFRCLNCTNHTHLSLDCSVRKSPSSDIKELNEKSKPVRTGTPNFIEELKSRHFSKAENVVKTFQGQLLTVQYLQSNGFDTPIIIPKKEGLDMMIPPTNLSLHDIENYIGGDKEIDVIDVTKQNNIHMKLKEFIEYFNDPVRSRVLNVISLEFTNTRLSPLVEAPYIARKLDWVNYVWPRDWPADHELKKPEVQKYCLIGVKDSFTDFHIDFGGTSVWYHIVRGEKVFYFIKPTQANLQLYQQWMCSSSQGKTFFGDQVDVCYKCTLKQGQTMLIPTGWIHAVFTPVDSLVFGGNFLHSLNIPIQIQIYEIEKKLKTPAKFQYPGFETIHWFAAKRLLKEVKDLNSEGRKCPRLLLHGIKALLSILKIWNTDKDYNMLSRSQIPDTIISHKLLKELSKEIRHAEKFLLSLDPPKPERESQRKRKKRVIEDFIGLDILNNTVNLDDETMKSKSNKNGSTLKNKKTLKKPPVKLNTLEEISGYSHVIQSNQNCLKTSNVSSGKFQNTKKVVNSYNKKGIVLKFNNQDPTVVKVRLGKKDVAGNINNDLINVVESFMIDSTIETRKELTWKQSSVYDFHDGSNESDHGITINHEQKKELLGKLIVDSSNNIKKKKEVMNGELNSLKNNGIDDLLKASGYAFNKTSIMMNNNSDRASPSTRDAIAGMLSFSRQCYPSSAEKYLKARSSEKKKTEVTEAEDENELLIENIEKVHQDADFIYPSFEVSDDDEFTFKSKTKKEKDEVWSPKIKVGPSFPKVNRPSRDGARRTAVERGLKAAAKKLARQCITLKRVSKKKKTFISPATESTTASNLTDVDPLEYKQLSQDLKSSNNASIADNLSCASIFSSCKKLSDIKAKLAASVPIQHKSRKGMKTAKQRLGRILKIHKSIH